MDETNLCVAPPQDHGVLISEGKGSGNGMEHGGMEGRNGIRGWSQPRVNGAYEDEATRGNLVDIRTGGTYRKACIFILWGEEE